MSSSAFSVRDVFCLFGLLFALGHSQSPCCTGVSFRYLWLTCGVRQPPDSPPFFLLTFCFHVEHPTSFPPFYANCCPSPVIPTCFSDSYVTPFNIGDPDAAPLGTSCLPFSGRSYHLLAVFHGPSRTSSIPLPASVRPSAHGPWGYNCSPRDLTS